MGGFDKTSIKLNYKGYSKAPSIQSGEVIFDENNQAYLVIGSEAGKGDAHLYLMKQDSKTSFTETSKVKAPSILKTVGAPVYGEILVADVDSDGSEEIIASSNTVDDSNSLWVGRYLQIFDIKNGKLLERPDEITQSPTSEITKGNDWCHHLFFNEQSAWNEPILTCTTIQAQIKTKKTSFYTRNNNMLQQAKMKFKSYDDIDNFNWMRSFYPLTLNEQTIFVGRRITGKKIINGEEVYNSIKLYLIEPTEENKSSPLFDGRYSFDLIRYHDEKDWQEIGNGFVEVRNGEVIIDKDSSNLKTGSNELYDTFSGQIDEKGNVSGSVEIDYLSGKNRTEVFTLNGQIDKKIWGDSSKEDFFRVYFLLAKE